MISIKIVFKHLAWSIRDLIKLHQDGRLELSPHYQRNAIWALPAQRRLIDTIKKGYPIPNFFVRARSDNSFEMVDGQQRSRAILAFWHGQFRDSDKLALDENTRSNPDYKAFLESFAAYAIQVCILDRTVTDLDVERFYVLVNSSGHRLNAPELRKAEYYATCFLRIATEVAGSPEFEDINLFAARSTDRMNDIDFVSELLTFLLHGFTDKKGKLDATYEADITEEVGNQLKSRCANILRRISDLQSIAPINRTRFRQKNDFYTLFAFLALHEGLTREMLQHFYRILLRLSPHIRPSQEDCEPLKNYALNCVSQSNSKSAREARHRFLESLFLNASEHPNIPQQELAQYFRIPATHFERRWGYLLLPLDDLKDPHSLELNL